LYCGALTAFMLCTIPRHEKDARGKTAMST
jgi:hypothetical protein